MGRNNNTLPIGLALFVLFGLFLEYFHVPLKNVVLGVLGIVIVLTGIESLINTTYSPKERLPYQIALGVSVIAITFVFFVW